MKTKVMYKIIDNNTGLYSSGGLNISWVKEGKIWTNKSGLTQHLKSFYRESPYADPKLNIEIVMLELAEIDRITIEDYMANRK